jgi:hypothetical protein
MEQVLPLGVGTSGRGKELGKGYGRVNIVQILFTYVCKWKNETCFNYSRNGGGRVKKNDGGSEFKYDILYIL